MSRNANSHFALNPTNIDMSRSKFSRSCSVKTSFNVGDIVPFFLDEVLPGDTFNIDTSKVVRLQTPLTPFMDNLYLDTYYFFVPNRLVWDHWKNLMGENTESAWIPKVEYQVPQVTAPAGGWEVGTIADYMGIPTGVSNLSVSALPFRAYALIMNEWFRDQNLCDPLNIPVDDTTIAGSNGKVFVSDVVKGGKPYIAAKYHDYFTSCLPAPQKGEDVVIPVGNSAPVVGTGHPLALYGGNTVNMNLGFLTTMTSPNVKDNQEQNYRYMLGLTNAGIPNELNGVTVGASDISNKSANIPGGYGVGVPKARQFKEASIPYEYSGFY